MTWFDCPRILEILEETDGRLSSTRLCTLVGLFVGSAVIIKLTWTDKLTLEMFSAYLLFCAGLYGLNRVATASEVKAQFNPPPKDNTQPLGPTTIINTGSPITDPIAAKDVSVKADGDVTVSK